jgi:hypothetical protein
VSIFVRPVLEKMFPDNPRAVAAMERLDSLLSDVNENGQTLSDRLDAAIAKIGDGSSYQKANPVLEAIANVPNRVGAVEITNDGAAAVRPIDGQDPASLLSRGVAYTVLVGNAGMGPTANRPVFPDGYIGIYFDTDIDPDGQPIIRRTDGVWLNMSGVPV